MKLLSLAPSALSSCLCSTSLLHTETPIKMPTQHGRETSAVSARTIQNMLPCRCASYRWLKAGLRLAQGVSGKAEMTLVTGCSPVIQFLLQPEISFHAPTQIVCIHTSPSLLLPPLPNALLIPPHSPHHSIPCRPNLSPENPSLKNTMQCTHLI